MVLSMMACLFGLSIQSSFDSIRPFGPCSSRVGFWSRSEKGNDGPIARTITFFGCVPVTMNPPIKTFSPVSTRNRVEILASWPGTGVGVGVAVGFGVGVAVGFGVGVAVGFGVGVAVGFGVGVADGW